MDLTRAEALASARKLARTLDSAPDPQAKAKAAVALLLKAGPWSAASERQVLDLAAWIATRPPPTALKPRCQAVLKSLA